MSLTPHSNTVRMLDSKLVSDTSISLNLCICVQHRYSNGSHYWYETAISTIESVCKDKPPETPLTLDRYEMSSLEAMQLGFVSTAIGFGLYHIMTMHLLCWNVKEKVQAQQNNLPLVSSVMRSLNNAAFRPLLGMIHLVHFQQNCVGCVDVLQTNQPLITPFMACSELLSYWEIAGAWAMDGLALAALVTMFPFYIRYVIMPDGVVAIEKGQALDPNVRSMYMFSLLTHTSSTHPCTVLVLCKFSTTSL